jgi:hypothetical protein
MKLSQLSKRHIYLFLTVAQDQRYRLEGDDLSLFKDLLYLKLFKSSLAGVVLTRLGHQVYASLQKSMKSREAALSSSQTNSSGVSIQQEPNPYGLTRPQQTLLERIKTGGGDVTTDEIDDFNVLVMKGLIKI